MKKFLSLLLALAMVFTFCGVFQPDTAIAEDDLPDAPVIEKPIQITVVDDMGSPVSGTTIKVTDEGGNEISTDTLETELFVTFLEKGTYTFEITDVPEGYLIKDGQKTITVTLTEGEEKDNITANSFQSTYHSHNSRNISNITVCIPATHISNIQCI